MCAPRSGNQKGSVERIVGWVKNSFFKVRRFQDRADLVRQLEAWLVEVNTKTPSRAHGLIPETRRREELPRLRRVRVTPESLALRVPIVVTPTAEVRHDGGVYSMPPETHGMAGTIHVFEQRVRIVVGTHVVEQRRRHKGDPPARLPEHRDAKVAAVRGTRAKLYEKRQQVLELGRPAEDFLTEARHRDPRHHPALVDRLFELLQEHGDAALRRALVDATAARGFKASDVQRALRTLSAERRRRLEEPARRQAQPRGARRPGAAKLVRRAEPRGGRS